MVSATTPQPRTRRGGRYLKYTLNVLVLAGLVAAGMKYIQGDLFWKAVHRFDWIYAPIVFSLTIGYVLVKGWRFVGMMRELTEVNRWTLMKAYVAGQACTLLPGGMAARAGILKQVGIPPANTAAPIAISGLSDQLLFVAASLIAALWFEPVRRPVLIILGVLIGLSVLLGVEATRSWLLGLIERMMGRFRLLSHWREFLESLKEVSTAATLLSAVMNAGIGFLLMVIALDLCARGVGAEIGYLTLMLAYTLPTMLGRISAMPGGVGVTEAGMISILNAAPGVTLDQAAAGTIIFRLGTVVFAALFGAAVYMLAWRGRKETAA